MRVQVLLPLAALIAALGFVAAEVEICQYPSVQTTTPTVAGVNNLLYYPTMGTQLQATCFGVGLSNCPADSAGGITPGSAPLTVVTCRDPGASLFIMLGYVGDRPGANADTKTRTYTCPFEGFFRYDSLMAGGLLMQYMSKGTVTNASTLGSALEMPALSADVAPVLLAVPQLAAPQLDYCGMSSNALTLTVPPNTWVNQPLGWIAGGSRSQLFQCVQATTDAPAVFELFVGCTDIWMSWDSRTQFSGLGRISSHSLVNATNNYYHCPYTGYYMVYAKAFGGAKGYTITLGVGTGDDSAFVAHGTPLEEAKAKARRHRN